MIFKVAEIQRVYLSLVSACGNYQQMLFNSLDSTYQEVGNWMQDKDDYMHPFYFWTVHYQVTKQRGSKTRGNDNL
jgi:hypothetical protein